MNRGACIERNGIEYNVIEFSDGPWLPDYTGPKEMVFVYEYSSRDYDNPYWADATEFQLMNSVQAERDLVLYHLRDKAWCYRGSGAEVGEILTEIADYIERGDHN